MAKLELLISEEEINKNLKEMCKQLDADYRGEELTIVMIMKGAICLVADLIRHLTIPTTVEFLSASSYGHRGTMRGTLSVENLDTLEVKDKHLLIVDDIFHTGRTLDYIVKELKKKQPKSIKSCVMLLKEKESEVPYMPEYHLFKIGGPFVVGYGMDYKEHYRGLRGIYIFESE